MGFRVLGFRVLGFRDRTPIVIMENQLEKTMENGPRKSIRVSRMITLAQVFLESGPADNRKNNLYWGISKDIIGVILGLYKGYIRVTLGSY